MSKSKQLAKSLSGIQRKLKAPKGQFNSFGKYNYRSCEDILEAVKPLLGDLILNISDEVIEVGGRVYIKSTAGVSDGEFEITVSAVAREAETKKGMDDAQITGSASSYARKYALNGLFCIDDNKDPDTGPSVDEGFENAKKHQGHVRSHWSSIAEIKISLENGHTEDAMSAWFEIPKEDRPWLLLSPSKGGIFTTAEGKIITGPEFRARMQELIKSGDEAADTVE